MRPKKTVYTLSAAHADGFCDGVTGDISVTPWTTIVAAPADGCAHETQLVLASGGSLAAVTLTITGTDAEGRVQSESIAGPSATSTLANYNKTITSILSSATLGASTMDVGWTAVCHTPCYPVARFPHGAHSIGVNLGGTTVTYTAQVSNDNVYENAPAQWHTLGTGNADHDQMLEATDGATGVRIDVASHTSGVLYVTHSQAGS
jgi:hypothetical protein